MPNDARFWAAAGQAPQQAASRIRKGPLTGTKLALGWGRRGRRKRVGAQRCCAPTQQYSQLGATYLRPVIARLALVGCMLVGDLRRLRRQETRQRERDGTS